MEGKAMDRIAEKEMQPILKAFGIQGSTIHLEVLSNGNINATYKVDMEDGRGYIVQGVNTNVFKDPYPMMRNIELVTTHIRQAVARQGGDPSRSTLNFHRTVDGSLLLPFKGGVFRLSDYIHDSVAYNCGATAAIMNKAGMGFGTFESQLADFDAAQLTETIPNFHNTKLRIEAFEKTLGKDPLGRTALCMKEVEHVLEGKEKACTMCDMLERGELPLRVTHNDTKTNNILFDKNTHEFLAVIDLDTVMPGLLAYDAADTIRFSANTAAEDEKDLRKVSLDLGLYEAFLEGFLEKTAHFMTSLEKETLVLGIQTIVYEQALRFLDDYIAGDVYYKTSRPRHNLDRARCQLALYDDMKRKESQMNSIVRGILQSTLGG